MLSVGLCWSHLHSSNTYIYFMIVFVICLWSCKFVRDGYNLFTIHIIYIQNIDVVINLDEMDIYNTYLYQEYRYFELVYYQSQQFIRQYPCSNNYPTNILHGYVIHILSLNDLSSIEGFCNGRKIDIQINIFILNIEMMSTIVDTSHPCARMVGLTLKWVRLAPNETIPGLFQIRFQCIWRPRMMCHT